MSLSILFVDDEVDVMALYVRFLQRHGFRDVAVASNSQDAIDYIESKKPGLVFLDISLGEDSLENGMEVLKRAREIAPQAKICMMSAYRDEYEQPSLAMGAYAFIAKPFKPDALLVIAEAANK